MEDSGINTRDVIFATCLIARLYLFLAGGGGIKRNFKGNKSFGYREKRVEKYIHCRVQYRYGEIILVI